MDCPDLAGNLLWKDFVQDYIAALGPPDRIIQDGIPHSTPQTILELTEGAKIDLELLWSIEMFDAEKLLFNINPSEDAAVSLSIQYPLKYEGWYGNPAIYPEYDLHSGIVSLR